MYGIHYQKIIMLKKYQIKDMLRYFKHLQQWIVNTRNENTQNQSKLFCVATMVAATYS